MSGRNDMPTLFVGHGSPLNVAQDDAYARNLTRVGASLPRPRAVVVVSAHWRTPGVQVLEHPEPPTIHDFSGFPKPLYDMHYKAPGAVEVAREVRDALGAFRAKTTPEWGLDHGAWTVLWHLFPKADVPVTQLAIDKKSTLAEHFAIAQALKPLRESGVLILGSGNITHNFAELAWDEQHAGPKPWAVAFDDYIKKALERRDVPALLAQNGLPREEWKRALPTWEHYIPLIYALGAADPGTAVSFFNEEIQMGALAMRSVRFG